MRSNIFGYLGFLLLKILGLIPLKARSSLGYAIGFAVGSLPSKALDIATLQIQKFLKLPNPKKIARQSFAQIGQTCFECIGLKEMIKYPEKYMQVANQSEIDRIIYSGKGVVALTAHMANFDAMGAYFAARKVNLLAIAKQLRNPAFQKTLELLRNSFGFQTLWRSNKSGIRRIFEALEKGWSVVSLVDHDTRVGSAMIPFFGQPANTPKSLVEIAKKTNSTIISIFVIRNAACKFEIICEEIPADLSTEEILLEFNSRLEALIKLHPEQWSWTHKRWRAIDGQRLGGVEYLNYLKNLT